MKKSILSAAAFAVVAVSAVAVAPTTSEAIPAFARQTGAACLSCHFQSFPGLTAFGRSFKYNAFTDVGEQALIEDDALSIPSSLNATIVVRPQLQSVKTTGTQKVNTATLTADNVMLVAGRIGTNTGAFAEIGGGSFANIQLINSVDMGGFKAGISFFNTGFGSTAGMEVSNVGGQHGNLMGFRAITASQATNAGSMAQSAGITLFAANEMGFASLSGVAPSTAGGAVANGKTFRLAPQVRVFATPELAGFDAGIGFTWNTGKVGNQAAGTSVKAERFVVDAQLQGELGDMQFGAYADYASAKATNAATGYTNVYNAGAGKLTAYSLRATIKPIHTVVLGVGFGNNKTAGVTKVDTWKLGAEYEIYQNFVVALTYQSAKTKPIAGVSSTTNTTLLDIEALM